MRRPSSAILASMASCMALQMTGLVIFQPLFARRFESLGAGVEALGLSAMAFALASLLAAPPMGALADRIGRRPIILLSLLAYLAAFSGYLLAASATMLILLRGLAGVFTAGLIPAMMGIVGDLAPEDRRGRWIGVVSGGASVGWVVGPLLGGWLYDGFGFAAASVISIAMTAGALLLAMARIPETRPPSRRSPRPFGSWRLGWRTLPSRSTLLLLLLITFGVMFAWAFIEPQFMFFAYDDLGWTSSQLGLVMSMYGLAFMLGGFTLGQLSDRLGRKPVIVFGLALFSAQFIGLVVFRESAWIIVSFLLAGLGNALYDPALSAMILDLTPSELTAGVLGLKSTAGSLGNMLGPALLVLLTPFTAPQTVFAIATGIVAAVTVVSGLALRLPEASVNPPRPSKAALTR